MPGTVYISDVPSADNAHQPDHEMQQLADRILLSNDEFDRRKALESLKQYPLRETLPLWLDLLKKTSSFTIKKMIIDHISQSADRSIVMPIVDELSSPFLTVRESAIAALKKIRDDRMYPSVLNMARNENPIYRVYALEAISHIYDSRLQPLVLEMLRDDNKSVRYYALRCVENNRLREMLPLIRNTALSDPNWEVRIKAIDIIRLFNDAGSVYVLLKCLNDPITDIRYTSALTLNRFRMQNTAIPVSMRLAAEEDSTIKKILIDTLIRLRSGGGFYGLNKVIISDPESDLRVLAAFAMGEIGDAHALPILLKAMDDPDYRVAAESCWAAASMRYQRQVAAKLMEVMHDATGLFLRTSALYALQKTGDRSAIPQLFDLYTVEQDPVFREKLRLALRGMLR